MFASIVNCLIETGVLLLGRADLASVTDGHGQDAFDPEWGQAGSDPCHAMQASIFMPCSMIQAPFSMPCHALLLRAVPLHGHGHASAHAHAHAHAVYMYAWFFTRHVTFSLGGPTRAQKFS